MRTQRYRNKKMSNKSGMTDIIDDRSAGTLDGLFRERVRRTPEGVAYCSHDRESGIWGEMSWKEIAFDVGRWQAALEEEGLSPGDRVALALRNSIEWVCFEQAALGLGLVVVPLYPDDRPENSAHILEDAGVRLLLVRDADCWNAIERHSSIRETALRVLLLKGRGAELHTESVISVAAWLPKQPTTPKPHGREPDSLATIVYTSGTTGRPKGVMLSHANLLFVTGAALSLTDVYPWDRFLSFLPLSHTLERTGGYYLPMMAGSSVAFARSAQQLTDDLQTIQPTLMISVPRIFERFYARILHQMESAPVLTRWLFNTTASVGWGRFEYLQGRGGWGPQLLLWPLLKRLVADKVTARLGGQLRMTVSGGAALNPKVAKLFLGLGVPILQGYGMTESSPVISVNTPENNDPLSVGPALPGVEVRIGATSELLAKGAGVMLGYWENPDATAEIIDNEGWLHTGDQARIKSGRLYITGRIKDILVLSNGEKVSPGDMEAAITLDGLFEQALVIGEGQPFLAAILVLNREKWQVFASRQGVSATTPESLLDKRTTGVVQARVAKLLKGFPGYAKVRRVILTLEPWGVEQGLLTPTLKIRRRQVQELFAQQIERIYGQDV